jgi:DNA-binding transcriptional LysR family regulator
MDVISPTKSEDMELRHLRYFIAVAEELHFGRAAARLHMTQPPLSLQIQALERELGVQLLVRGRTTELTEAGRAFLEKARWAIEAADEAARAAQQARQETSGRLRLGLPTMAVCDLAPVALRTFQEWFPEVAVETTVAPTGTHLEALRAEQLDIAFVCGGVLDPEAMHFRPLHSEPLVLTMPEDHPLSGLFAVRVEQLAGEPIVFFPRSLEPPLYHYLVTDVLGRSRVAPLVALEATTLQSTYSAVAAKLGVAFAAESTARIVKVPGVVHRPFIPSPPVLRHGVAWRRARSSNAVRWFLDVLDELTGAREERCPSGGRFGRDRRAEARGVIPARGLPQEAVGARR